METIKKMSILSTTGETKVKGLAVEAQNVDISYDASGNIINDITEPGVVVDHVRHLPEIVEELLEDIDDNSQIMTGATAEAAGEKGQVPAPAAGDNEKFLRGDGTFSNSTSNFTVGTRQTGSTVGDKSLSVGTGNRVSSANAIAAGADCRASASNSMAQGNVTQALKTGSHAEGDHTIANQDYQHVSGKYNNNKTDTLFEVGNGSVIEEGGEVTEERSNAFEVTSDGYIRTKGRDDKIAFGVDSNGNYGYIKAGADTVTPFRNPKGDATADKVLIGSTFANAESDEINGSMPNNGAVSQSLDCGASYAVPAGYHNGSGIIVANSLASQTGVDSGKSPVTAGTMVSGYQGWVNGNKVSGTFAAQEKTVTAGTSAASVTPDSGKYLSKVTYNPTPSQTKTATAGTSATSVTPDSGKLLSKVTINPTPSQTKTVTSSRSNQTVTPDSGKLLSSVTVNGLAPTGTYTPTTRAANIDMGATSNYRYVTTTSVPNSNSGTYTPTTNGSALDMGVTNTYRYVNTNNVFNLGWNSAIHIEDYRYNSVGDIPSSFSRHVAIPSTVIITVNGGGCCGYIRIRFNSSNWRSDARFSYAGGISDDGNSYGSNCIYTFFINGNPHNEYDVINQNNYSLKNVFSYLINNCGSYIKGYLYEIGEPK